jgi:hypothetical protein
MRRAIIEALSVTIVAAAVGFIVWSSASLPEVVATHFPSGGRATGLMARADYVWLMAALAAVVPGIIFGLGTMLARFLPRFYFGPHAGYWLAPERCAATLSSLRRHMAGTAVVASLFIAGLHAAIIEANAAQPPQFQSRTLALLLGAFLLLIAALAVAWHRRFRHPH